MQILKFTFYTATRANSKIPHGKQYTNKPLTTLLLKVSLHNTHLCPCDAILKDHKKLSHPTATTVSET